MYLLIYHCLPCRLSHGLVMFYREERTRSTSYDNRSSLPRGVNTESNFQTIINTCPLRVYGIAHSFLLHTTFLEGLHRLLETHIGLEHFSSC